MATTSHATTPKAERTRGAILGEAERIFAARGFDAARLEDVAEAVGIRRASIVYHFRDKRELYEAVLAAVCGDLESRLRQAFAARGTPQAKIEAAVGAWVDAIGRRPALARLLLREVAGATPDRQPAVLAHLAPIRDLVQQFIDDIRADGLRPSYPVHPAHAASAIAGATVFFVAAVPSLVPDAGFDPMSPTHLDVHRRELLDITRRLLGLEADPARPEARRPKRGSRAGEGARRSGR